MVALLLFLVLSTGEKYEPPVTFYKSEVLCMDKAMTLTDSYRKSDLKSYTVQCITPAF